MRLHEQRIDDRSDERIAPFRDVRDADLRGRDGLFCVESPRIVQRFLHALSAAEGGVPAAPRVRVRSLLLSPEALEGLRGPLLQLPEACAAHPELPVYCASADLLTQLAGYRMHQGALALGERPDPARLGCVDALLEAVGGDGDLVATCGVVHTDNIGGLFRSAGSFGGVGVLLGDGSSDPLHRKAIRVSSGRVFAVPWGQTQSLADELRRLRAHGFALIAAENAPGAVALDEAFAQPAIRAAPRRLVVMGAEGDGVPGDIRELCDVVAAIPMRRTGGLLHGEDRPSLNVAVASALFLHRLRSARGHSGSALGG